MIIAFWSNTFILFLSSIWSCCWDLVFIVLANVSTDFVLFRLFLALMITALLTLGLWLDAFLVVADGSGLSACSPYLLCSLMNDYICTCELEFLRTILLCLLNMLVFGRIATSLNLSKWLLRDSTSILLSINYCFVPNGRTSFDPKALKAGEVSVWAMRTVLLLSGCISLYVPEIWLLWAYETLETSVSNCEFINWFWVLKASIEGSAT